MRCLSHLACGAGCGHVCVLIVRLLLLLHFKLANSLVIGAIKSSDQAAVALRDVESALVCRRCIDRCVPPLLPMSHVAGSGRSSGRLSLLAGQLRAVRPRAVAIQSADGLARTGKGCWGRCSGRERPGARGAATTRPPRGRAWQRHRRGLQGAQAQDGPRACAATSALPQVQFRRCLQRLLGRLWRPAVAEPRAVMVVALRRTGAMTAP